MAFVTIVLACETKPTFRAFNKQVTVIRQPANNPGKARGESGTLRFKVRSRYLVRLSIDANGTIGLKTPVSGETANNAAGSAVGDTGDSKEKIYVATIH